MIAVSTISDVREALAPTRRDGAAVGFVPTMGALHDGHVSLIERARAECAVVVVSVFVNPAQFGPNEDFASYPRRLAGDVERCRAAGVDVVFHPSAADIYDGPPTPWIRCGRLGDVLCGRRRPGHFDGVCLIVAKLLNIVMPAQAYFGQKDAQQVIIIRRMVDALDMPVEIVTCPTRRAPDGLALSSRNDYLTQRERAQAPAIFGSLCALASAVRTARSTPEQLLAAACEHLTSAGPFEIEYYELVDPHRLEPWDGRSLPVLAAVAARLGACRLIDNLLIDDSGSSG